MKRSLFLFCALGLASFSIQGVIGDGPKLRMSDDEAAAKMSGVKTKKCYQCQGCSDATKLTEGDKKDCTGDAFANGTSKFYKPLCSITIGPHGVKSRGCLTNFMDQYSPLDKVDGQCGEVRYKKEAGVVTCWCDGKLCNFGPRLRPDASLGAIAAAASACALVLFNFNFNIFM